MATDPDKQPDPAPTSEPGTEAEKAQAFLDAMKFADVFQAARDEALEWSEMQQQGKKAKRKKNRAVHGKETPTPEP